MSSRPLLPYACEFHNASAFPLMIRFTNVDTRSCRMMMIERTEGVTSVAVRERTPWLRWLFAPNIEWIECAVEPQCRVKLHADASAKLALVARIHRPLVHKFTVSQPTRFVLHFKHDDDTQVYQYRLTLDSPRVCSDPWLKELILRTQMLQNNSPHDGVQIVALGEHVFSNDSDLWDHFVVQPPSPPPENATLADSETSDVPFIQTTSS